MADVVPISDAIGYGWEKAKGNLRFFILSYVLAGLALVPSGVCLVLTAVFAASSDWTLTVIFGILMVLSWLVVYVGLFIAYVKAGIRINAGEELTVRDCMPALDEWWKVFIANCIYLTLVGIGFLLCVIPGIWLAVKYWGYCWFIVEQGSGPVEAFREAGELSDGLTLELLVYFVICGVILGLGALAFIVGLALAFPVVLIATTYVFSKLAGLPVAG